MEPPDTDKTVFDRFADKGSKAVARAPFFAGCVLLVVVWAPSILLIRNIDTWQLVINTVTTIVTFLLVALLQNTQARNERAVNHKLDAMADAQADLMVAMAEVSDDDTLCVRLLEDAHQLREAVGIEGRVSA